MNRYKLAKIARPLVLALFPAVIVLGFVLQWVPLVVIIVGLMTPLLWYLKCKSCSASVYFDAAKPIRTLLAVPHKTCTKCGASNEG